MKTVYAIILPFLFIYSCSADVISKGISGNGEVVTEIREIDSYFNKIEVRGFFDVTVEDGNNQGEAKIEAESNLLDYVSVYVENSILIVENKERINIRTRKPITVYVTSKTINSVTIKGSGDVNVKTPQHVESFEAEIKGSGDLKALVETAEVSAKIKGSGDITLKGSTDEFKASISGSGDISAFDLTSKRCGYFHCRIG